MVEKKVNICDKCHTIIAKNKCEICNKDICEICEGDLDVNLYSSLPNKDGKNPILRIICCKNCSHGLIQTKLKTYFDDKSHREIRKNIIEIFKNALTINNLQDLKAKKEMDVSWNAKKAKKANNMSQHKKDMQIRFAKFMNEKTK